MTAYGDATAQHPPVPWVEFEYTEYLFRLRDLLEAREGAFAVAHGDPDDPRAAAADEAWRRYSRDLEETALEFAAYAARLRLGPT